MKKLIKSIEKNTYEVIEVSETNNKSMLTVRLIYDSYLNMSTEEMISAYNSVIEDLKIIEEEIDDENFIVVLSYKFYEKFKNKTERKSKIIKVYMDKKDGLWDITSDDNDEFHFSLFPIFETFEVLDSVAKNENGFIIKK